MFESNKDDERGAVPVVGVVLMVAITIVLAAATSAFVLDLGNDVEENVQAGVSVNAEGGEIVVSYVSAQKDDVSLDITVDGSDEGSLSEVGKSKRIKGYSGQTRVLITATDGETTTVVYDNEVFVS